MNIADALWLAGSIVVACAMLWGISLTGDHGPKDEAEQQDWTW